MKLPWAKIKTALVLVPTVPFAILTAMGILPVPEMFFEPNVTTFLVMFGFGIFGLFFVLAIQLKNPLSNPIWTYPKWDSSPFTLRDPLQFFYFMAWFFITCGLSNIIISPFAPTFFYGLAPFSIGIGMATGLRLFVLAFPKKFKQG